MKIRKMYSKSMSVYLALATSILVSCGKVQVKSTGGNAILVLDSTKDITITDQELTLKRLRIWKSAPNNVGPGVVSLVDSYVAEIWFRAVGDENDQYTIISDLQSDSNGDLFPSTNRPGKVYSEVGSDNNVYTYTVTAQDGFITQKYIVPSEYSSTLNFSVTNPKTNSTKFKSITELGVSEWANLYRYSFSSGGLIFSRMRLVENTTGLSTKAVCAVTKFTTATSISNTTIAAATNKLDLGSYIDTASDNQLGSTDANGKTNERSDDKLYIRYFEDWYVTGLNVNSRSVRTMRARAAGIYNSRHLKADSSATTPAESGYNKLIRECNAAAKPGSGEGGSSNIKTAYAAIDSGIPTPTQPEFGELKNVSNSDIEVHSYCAALDAATNAKDYMVSLVNAANATPPGLDCGTDWSTVNSGENQWTAANGYSQSVGSIVGLSLQYAVEQTAITASTF